MSKLEQAARQALEALEELFHSNSTKVAVEKYNMAHTALREALASRCQTTTTEQAEQEPVAWVWLDDWLNDGYPEDCFSRVNHQNKTPLYAAPVRTKDLADDEITNAWESMGRGFGKYTEFARAVIAADRAKNNLCERTK